MENHFLTHRILQQLRPISGLATGNKLFNKSAFGIGCGRQVMVTNQKRKRVRCSSNSTTSETSVDSDDMNHTVISKSKIRSTSKDYECRNSHQEISAETTDEPAGCNDASASHGNQSIFLRARHTQGHVVRTMMHKTYLNLKEKQLHVLYEQQGQKKSATNAQSKNAIPQSCSRTDDRESHAFFHPARKNAFSASYQRLHDGGNASDNQNIKQQFYDILYNKYQDPTPKEVKQLSAQFRDPEKLFKQVVQFLSRADPNCKPNLIITDHLQQHYWKAQLTLPWSSDVTVKGIHPNRDQAIKGAYWLMCQRLMLMAFISHNDDGTWIPMTCDKVVTMLETLSKYGESSLGSAKGRGFKIILEQIKDREIVDDVNNSFKDSESTKENSYPHSGKKCTHDISDANICFRNESEKRGSGNVGLDLDDHVKDIAKGFLDIEACTFNADPGLELKSPSNKQHLDFSKSENNEKGKNTSDDRTMKANEKMNWLCTVHVGWPYPFTVEAEGVSLPSAQMMGYIAVVNRLKAQKLLTICNNAVSCRVLENVVACHTLNHWEQSIAMLWDTDVIEKFNASAEIFCDASKYGFGAYLLLKDSQKVSWMCETWQDFGMNKELLLTPNRRYLQSSLAELFTVVTAVFSWKQKLQGRKVLCFSDNMTIMGMINSFKSDPVESDKCIGPSDHLIYILQSTCLHYNIEMQATWLQRDKNWLADCLSRSDIKTFQKAVPEAAYNKTTAKKLKLKTGTYTS